MSWSVFFMGKPSKIVEALQKQSTTLTGPSKEEYDAALPNLIGLVSQNKNRDDSKIIKLTAGGSAWIRDGELQDSSCTVQLESLGSGLLV